MQDNHEKPNSNRNNEADEGRNVRPFANGSGQPRKTQRPQGAPPHSGQAKPPQRRRPAPPQEEAQQYYETADMPRPRPQQSPNGQNNAQRPRKRPTTEETQQYYESSDIPRQRPQPPRSSQSGESRSRQPYYEQSTENVQRRQPPRRQPQQQESWQDQQYSSDYYMEEEAYAQDAPVPRASKSNGNNASQAGKTHKAEKASKTGNTSKTGKASKSKKKKKQNLSPEEAARKKRNRILLFVGEILLLLVLVISFWAVTKVRKVKFVKINDGDVAINLEIKQQLETGESAMKGYRTIVLFGVDSREGELEKNTRTDTIIIASINLDSHEVRMASVYRDTWLNLSTDTYNKANAAYAKGGPKQAINMLNMNLDLNITDFVTAGFDGLIDLVDAVGGVEIDVKESEIGNLNDFQISIVGKPNGTLNAKGEPNYEADPGTYTPVKHAGLQTLNGLQATAYCRIRYVGNGDFERTQRQQAVLKQVAKKAITLNPSTLDKIAEAVFPKIATSLEWDEISTLLKDIAQYEIGETTGFPFEGNVKVGRVGKASVVVPVDLEQNVKLLHEFFFDEETDYSPSDTVKKCSKKIAADTGVSASGS